MTRAGTAVKLRKSRVAGPWVELYRTQLGKMIVGRSEDYLDEVAEGSIDLLMTSPPSPYFGKKPMAI